jgi:hypothetical protein
VLRFRGVYKAINLQLRCINKAIALCLQSDCAVFTKRMNSECAETALWLRGDCDCDCSEIVLRFRGVYKAINLQLRCINKAIALCLQSDCAVFTKRMNSECASTALWLRGDCDCDCSEIVLRLRGVY